MQHGDTMALMNENNSSCEKAHETAGGTNSASFGEKRRRQSKSTPDKKQSLAKKRIRDISYRRRRAFAYWRPLGISQCKVVQGLPCDYYPTNCDRYNRWHHSKATAYPPCFEEVRRFKELTADFEETGIPRPLCRALASNLIRSGRSEDLRFPLQHEKMLTNLSVEMYRAKDHSKTNGNGDNINLSAILAMSASQEDTTPQLCGDSKLEVNKARNSAGRREDDDND